MGCVAFPVGDRLCMYAELVGNLPLKKIEVQSPSADVIPKRIELLGILCRLGSQRSNLRLEWQNGNAGIKIAGRG